MKEFWFNVTRNITESVRVRVPAETIEEAHQKALEDVEEYADTDALGNLEWEADDSFQFASDPYIRAPEEYAEVDDEEDE